MKKSNLLISSIGLLLSLFLFLSCSSSGDNPGDDDSQNNSNSGQTSGVVPDNTDSGNNNNSEPDNIIPDNPSNPDNPENGGTSNDGSDNPDNGSTDTPGNGDDSNNEGNTGDDQGAGGSNDNDSGNNGDSDNSDNNGSGSCDNDNNEGSDNSGNNSNPGTTTTWKLVFEDNFEGADSIPNQEYWSLAKKGEDTWNRNMSESYGQAYQKNGYLYLFGMQNKDGEYLTGGIETIDKFDFTYGQVKCRARFLRHPKGNHTGIWMMPEPPAQKWPKSGEIDIMEHLNSEAIIYETVHFWNEEKEEDDKSDATASIDVEDFNIYGIIWNKSSVSFTVNGEVKFTYKNNDSASDDFNYAYPFTKPFYLILSQSLGGEGTWAGPIDDSELPAIFQIDWIKVWQKVEE